MNLFSNTPFPTVSKKSVLYVLFEATIVGVILVIIVNLFKQFLLQYIPNFSGNKSNIELLFIAGFLFHLVFEYTGTNLWYSKEYCKLL